MSKQLAEQEYILEEEKAKLEEVEGIKKQTRTKEKILESEIEEFLKNMQSVPGDLKNKTEEMKEDEKLRRPLEGNYIKLLRPVVQGQI